MIFCENNRSRSNCQMGDRLLTEVGKGLRCETGFSKTLSKFPIMGFESLIYAVDGAVRLSVVKIGVLL